MRSLYDISWQVSEPDYRKDDALSYSTIARFAKEGFNGLNNLYDRIETPSLTFGSAVDSLITGGQEEFDNNFMVADFPPITDGVLKMIKYLFNTYKSVYRTLLDIPTNVIIEASEIQKYQLNWKPETRAKVIKEQGNTYYSLLLAAGNKTVISVETKLKVDAAVRALHESQATSFYFLRNNPLDDSIKREYQLKFKATLNNVDYRCMADLILVDNENKVIYPIDLKTSGHKEWEFFNSFIQWRYDIQARLYWRIIRYNLDKDPYWKEYKLADYKFIVVNKESLTPLVWEFEDTQKEGTLMYGINKEIKLQDPCDLGSKLSYYLNNNPIVPTNININNKNSIVEWLNKERNECS